MASFIIRNINDQTWQQVKTRAKEEEWYLRPLLLALLQGYAEGRIILTKATAESEAKP